MADTATRLDWRAYARNRGIHPMHAWRAMQQACRHSYPNGAVTSPATLDRMADDPTMHDFIRAAIDDLAQGADQ